MTEGEEAALAALKMQLKEDVTKMVREIMREALCDATFLGPVAMDYNFLWVMRNYVLNNPDFQQKVVELIDNRIRVNNNEMRTWVTSGTTSWPTY